MLLVILLVGACSSILAQPPQDIHPPEYVAAAKALAELKSSLQRNVLSLHRPVPNLTDYRRHYVEIIHVIYKIASYIAHSCLLPDYDKEYQELINRDAPDALSDPLSVVLETEKISNLFFNDSEAFQNLIKQTCTKPVKDTDCDVVLDEIVRSDPKRYQEQAGLLLEGGKLFKALNKKNKEFEAVSKALEAHKYIIENPQKLKDIIYKLANIIRVIDPLYPPHKLSC